MESDEVLILANRSSNPGKKGLILANSIGVVDSDYYENPDNDGHIMYAFFNFKAEDVEIKKGERIGQAIFQKYLVTDNDIAQGERTGGFGSTNKQLWKFYVKYTKNSFDLSPKLWYNKKGRERNNRLKKEWL
mgnify:FL=1